MLIKEKNVVIIIYFILITSFYNAIFEIFKEKQVLKLRVK